VGGVHDGIEFSFSVAHVGLPFPLVGDSLSGVFLHPWHIMSIVIIIDTKIIITVVFIEVVEWENEIKIYRVYH